jgi:Lon protease-like protein
MLHALTEIDDKVLEEVPVFPLPQVVLFPHSQLPLHIFEPRYRQMLADCLAGDRRFGITPAGSQQEAPDPGTVGCTAEVRVNQSLPDGRSNIVVLGGERFIVTNVVDDPAPYYVAVVRTFDEEPGTAPAAGRTELLRETFTRYATLVRELSDVEPLEPDLPDEPLPLSFHVSAGIDVEATIKQRLLVERSTARRVEALLVVVAAVTKGVERALEVHRRAHTNGRGHARPPLPTSG